MSYILLLTCGFSTISSVRVESRESWVGVDFRVPVLLMKMSASLIFSGKAGFGRSGISSSRKEEEARLEEETVEKQELLKQLCSIYAVHS